jgi:hypothetical protein
VDLRQYRTEYWNTVWKRHCSAGKFMWCIPVHLIQYTRCKDVIKNAVGVNTTVFLKCTVCSVVKIWYSPVFFLHRKKKVVCNFVEIFVKNKVLRDRKRIFYEQSQNKAKIRVKFLTLSENFTFRYFSCHWKFQNSDFL